MASTSKTSTNELAKMENTNWEPVNDEMAVDITEYEGTIPPGLQGEFVRNGPNAHMGIKGLHLFDGDGMLHALRLYKSSDGSMKARYINRYVQTPRLQEERKAKRDLFMRIGQLRGRLGIIRMLLYPLRQMLGMAGKMDKADRRTGTQNTALAYFRKRLLALVESSLPFSVKMLQDGDFESECYESYGEKLNQPVSAHSKVDPETGEFLIYGYDLLSKPYCKYAIVDKDGNLSHRLDVEIPRPVMMHDFAVTKNYTIFLDMPLIFDPKRMARDWQYSYPFRFDASIKARFGICPRYAKSMDEFTWFETRPCYVFHTMNAYEDPENPRKIVLHSCRFEHIELEFDNSASPALVKWTFDLDTKEMTEELIVDNGKDTLENPVEIHGEFPRINDSYVGRVNRYGWFVEQDSDKGTFIAVVKLDLQQRSVAGCIDFSSSLGKPPGTMTGGECVFAPNTTTITTTEDGGYLMTFLYDTAAKESYYCVWDAATMAEAPVVKMKLPRRVPYGFHGMWVSEEQIQSGLH
ncbi:unnamed protein product [Vitrella brassicaformis CCMP3155]|uniref:Uncharacterized protein n=3 Tax=Vitrella brassicaformis TaxID=1169539 RepID=A0A0G4E883_VITBC|nr:unnamed protein product [Vitrella brassicaformis CCMP3155]|eukprot:CEL91800.1 unnamed protein product [Vitrella brassicaformis CCMP3155]